MFLSLLNKHNMMIIPWILIQFAAALGDVRYDKSVRAVILKSDVPRVFCAGAGNVMHIQRIG